MKHLLLLPRLARMAERGRRMSFRVVFAGTEHFLEALPLTRQALAERNALDGVELVQVPTEELPAALKSAHMALPFMERFSGELLRDSPLMQCVQQFGVGLEGVDAEACDELGIFLANMPGSATGNAEATAEIALWLTLGALRGAGGTGDGGELAQKFQARILGGSPLPLTLHGKRITVVGYGSVGRVLCRYFSFLGASRVAAVRRSPWSSVFDDSNDSESLERRLIRAESLDSALLNTTDVLVLACPLDDSTRGLVDAKLLADLPPGAVVVNVGRGPLVEHAAVLSGLESGRLRSYASDVGVGHPTKASEPWDPEDPLSLHPRTLFTPHVGGYADIPWRTMANLCADAIQAVHRGDPPAFCVNEIRAMKHHRRHSKTGLSSTDNSTKKRHEGRK